MTIDWPLSAAGFQHWYNEITPGMLPVVLILFEQGADKVFPFGAEIKKKSVSPLVKELTVEYYFALTEQNVKHL